VPATTTILDTTLDKRQPDQKSKGQIVRNHQIVINVEAFRRLAGHELA